MTVDYFDYQLALDEHTGRVMPGAQAQVFAISDTAFSSPLDISDMQDQAMLSIVASPTGIYPPFKAPGHTQVLVKSGEVVTPMSSLYAIAEAVGLDPETVAVAIASASASGASAVQAAGSLLAAEMSRDAAVAAQGAAEAARDAAEAVGATNDTIMAAVAGNSGSEFRGQLNDAFAGGLSVLAYGVVGNGVADDTNALIAAHTAANTFGILLSYSGVRQIAVRSNAQISVQTSVDFANVELVILGGVVASPDFNAIRKIFIIEDPACPVVHVTGSVSSSNLQKGSFYPTLGLFSGHGYARLTAGLQVPNGPKTGTMDYVQVFKVNRNGRTSQPLSTDLTAYAGSITLDYRATSRQQLKLENLSVPDSGWNNQTLFEIKRCNVFVDGLTVIPTASAAAADICQLVNIVDASDVWVQRFVTTGRQSSSTGSYALSIYGGADIYVDQMNALTGWGVIGTNNVNGLHFTHSVIKRVDVHSSGHNIFIEDCDLHEQGVMYGWGGGIISIKNSRVYSAAVIMSRSDYGGTFFGQFIVDDIELSSKDANPLTVVDLASNPLGASVKVHAPAHIKVSRVRRMGRSASVTSTLRPVELRVRGASDVVYAPHTIDISDIASEFAPWIIGAQIDTQSMEANPQLSTTRVLVSDCHPTSGGIGTNANASFGIVDYAQTHVPTAAPLVTVRIVNCTGIVVRIRNANTDVVGRASTINAIDGNQGGTVTADLDGCRLQKSDQWAGNGMRCGDITILRNTRIGASYFNLGTITAAIGCIVIAGAETPTLPTGVAPSQLWDGWRAP